MSHLSLSNGLLRLHLHSRVAQKAPYSTLRRSVQPFFPRNSLRYTNRHAVISTLIRHRYSTTSASAAAQWRYGLLFTSPSTFHEKYPNSGFDGCPRNKVKDKSWLNATIIRSISFKGKTEQQLRKRSNNGFPAPSLTISHDFLFQRGANIVKASYDFHSKVNPIEFSWLFLLCIRLLLTEFTQVIHHLC